MPVILDFCGYCGVILNEGQGLEENPHCFNCGADVTARDKRCQGIFSEEDANKMRSTS